jgi:hypothetical protein
MRWMLMRSPFDGGGDRPNTAGVRRLQFVARQKVQQIRGWGKP